MSDEVEGAAGSDTAVPTTDGDPEAADATSDAERPAASRWEGKRMAVVVGLVALAVVGLIAYLVWPRTPEYVLVVGDSVTFMSFEDLKGEFGSDTKLDPVARPGYRSSNLLPFVEEAVAARERSGKALERAVLLVGYNDVWKEEVGQNRLAELVDLSARFECAVWLTLPVRPAGEPPAVGDFDPELGDEWNELMADLVGEHDNLHLVADWADAIEGADSADEYLDDDGIHPNDAGQKLLAETMHDAVISSCRFP